MSATDPPAPEVRVVADPAALAATAAEAIARHALAAIEARGAFRIALSGGSTPNRTYALLAGASPGDATHVRWDRVDVFWGDERVVPADDSASNFRTADQALLSQVPIDRGRVHRVPTELGPDAAARAYETELRRVFDQAEGVPRFDLVMLGLGPDGHTASLFPGTPALAEPTRLVVANRADVEPRDRVSLTYPVLNAARAVLFLVSGANKAAVLREVLEGPPDPTRLPAQAVRPTAGELVWLVDGAAAAELTSTPA